jgi:hypothetical protein
MKTNLNNTTRHAIEQMTRRRIGAEVLDLLESYGESIKCRDGGKKLAFGKASRRLIRQDLGKATLKELSKHRTVYAVICNDKVVTVARSRSPIIKRD